MNDTPILPFKGVQHPSVVKNADEKTPQGRLTQENHRPLPMMEAHQEPPHIAVDFWDRLQKETRQQQQPPTTNHLSTR